MTETEKRLFRRAANSERIRIQQSRIIDSLEDRIRSLRDERDEIAEKLRGNNHIRCASFRFGIPQEEILKHFNKFVEELASKGQ